MSFGLGEIQRLLLNYINFQGSTSGTTQLKAAAAAGSTTVTLPGATTTLVGQDTTDTLTNKTLTAPTINGSISDSVVLCTTQFDAVTGTTGTTLTNVLGLSKTVVAGTYQVDIGLSTASTANTGIKIGFKLTTAVLSAIDTIGTGLIAAGSATTHNTTTTDQTLLFDTAAGVEVGISVRGILVFSTGGTFALQAAQHTANGDTTSVLINSYMKLTRIA